MMVKYSYLLLATMVFASTTKCMEDKPGASKFEDQALKQEKQGPQLPSEPENVAQYFEAAVVVSELKLNDIPRSEYFATMKASRERLKKQHHDNKHKVDEALYGAGDYFSDDEKDLKNCPTPEMALKRSIRLDAQISSIELKAHKNTGKLKRVIMWFWLLLARA